MKRILNKILCFMWGHGNLEDAIGVIIRWPWEEDIEINIKRCKHCGAYKHD